MTTIQRIKIQQPTEKQMAQLKKSVKKAAKGSYEKQMQVLKQYPQELQKALDLAKKY